MFTCEISSSNGFNCKKTAIPAVKESYTEADVGKVFYKSDGPEYRICIASGPHNTATAELSSTTHLLTLPANNVYGVETGKKGIIQVASAAPKSVTLAGKK